MSEWKAVKLGEVAEVNSKTISKNIEPEYIKYIDIESVDKGEIRKPKEMIYKEAPSRARRIVSDNDILISTVRPNLEHYAFVKKSEKNLIASTGFAVISCKALVDPRYLYYNITSKEYTEFLISRAEGAAYPAFNPDVLIKSEIPLPPLEVQRNIAKVLGDLDDKIELNRRMNETLEEMAMAVYRHYFVHFGLPPGAKEEATKCPFGKLVEHPEMGMIPEGWSVGKLGDVLKVKHGYAFKGEYFSEEITDLILLTPGNFKIGGGFNDKKFKYYKNNDFPKDYILSEDDIILTMTDLSVTVDTLGYPAFVPSISEKTLLHNQRLGKIILSESYLDYKYFFYHLFLMEDYRQWIIGSASGTTVKHTSPSRIEDFKIIIPEYKIINTFNRIVKSIYSQTKSNSKEIQTLTETRDYLLPRLLSGEVRVG